jgi:hypothetical protein
MRSCWKIVEGYGGAPEQIADAVIAEWIAAGCGDPNEHAVWFGKPIIDMADKAVP